MKRIVFAAAGLALTGLVLGALADYGRAQTTGPGPGEGGSVLKDPFAPAAPAPPASSPYLESLIKQPPTVQSNPNPANRYLQPYEEKPDINQDIQVTKELGPWMIMVHAYTGPEAAIMARQMVTELRGAYKLPAYTFNYGSEEKRKEYERKKSIYEKHLEFLVKNGLPQDQPFPIRTVRINEQVGVLIGGYPSEDAARRFLVDHVQKLKPLDPNKVMLDKKVFYGEGKKESSKAEKLQEVYVNPFLGAFVAHNPTVKQERPADWDKPDMALLRKLNAGESYSLLNNKKKLTLAVKEFRTPAMLQPKEEAPGSFLDALGLGGKGSQRVDAAATSAHNLAEYFHQAKLEAYVLHTKYYSVVCVGGYDSVDDPGLRNMANLIETKVLPNISQLFNTGPNQAVAQARVVPMQIPR
ncbi:MAG TPA: hypothetical protein VNX28_06825 [Gemmataceae bacterium]|jgi:hypothetical protein|nr:hypothetical protein [Gemmataceae bacterium]